jgi:hypothetical protein
VAAGESDLLTVAEHGSASTVASEVWGQLNQSAEVRAEVHHLQMMLSRDDQVHW